MKYSKGIIYFVALICFSAHAKNNDSTAVRNNHYVAFNLHNARLAAHYDELKEISGIYTGVDMRYFYQTNGEQFWHSLYGYPKLGIGLNFGELHNRAVGKSTAAYGFGTFPVFEHGNFKLEWDLCLGMGWVENFYDPITNPNNIGISSHVNVFFDINLNTSIAITDRTNAFIAVGISHFSNASWKQPNRGINMFALRTGITYRLENNKAKQYKPSEMPSINKKWGMDVRYGIGWRGITDHESQFLVSNIQALLTKRITNKIRAGFGIDAIKDGALISKQYLLDGNHTNQIGVLTRNLEGKKASLNQLGVIASGEFVIKRISLMTQIGVTAFYNYDSFPVFERFGIRCRVLDNLFVDVLMRSQANKAVDVTWGIGYSLNRGKN